MKEFLRKIKLIETFVTELQIEKNDLIRKFKQHVDEANPGTLNDLLDAFSSSKKEFKGTVEMDTFKIKRRKRFFDSSLPLVAEGTYRQKDESLVIEAEINGFPKIMIFFCGLLILFYLIALASTIAASMEEWRMATIAVPFLFIHAAFMFGIPYFIMRRSVKRMKHDLEREFYYMTKPEPRRYGD